MLKVKEHYQYPKLEGDRTNETEVFSREPFVVRCASRDMHASRMRTAELLLVVGLCVLSVTSSLKICAFNVQSFGESKANNERVMGILLKILSRCDLCLIQEVRDSKGEVIQALVKDLNRFDKSNSYSYLESVRLGRKSYKEQYVYIYRNNMLKVKEHYQYPKLEGDRTNETEVFSREPFVVRFHSPTTQLKDFVLIGHHTSPKSAMKEIDELFTVVKRISKKWRTDNVMILGDLNAGCSYVTIKGWKSVRLRSDPKFCWLIGDEQDTTVREKTHCAYDRIIVHGKEIRSSVVPGSAQPFNFKEAFHLTEAEALEVSDHFPVEVDLKPSHRYLFRHEL
ncbi:deoxyribonuclease I-like 1-like [Nematolebias whitei]|uniref:deoxyribonuclease I-like 1-like n=1 Tax=Nematolebias whitei TaxID=451745 RepID=UPI0018996E9E|nr:deoxyribonuclease I-like 1-like [Nematolebias whitei]